MGALYLTLTKLYKAENPMGGKIFLDVKDFHLTYDFLHIEHRVLTKDCMVVEMTTTIARRYIVDIQAFVNARDLNNYLGRYDHVYKPYWGNPNISYVIEREFQDGPERFHIDNNVVDVVEGEGELIVTYTSGTKINYPKSEAKRWRVIDYIKMR
nr:MAG TPA: hypothetical protein [Caudoviricetes sp.]